MKVKSERKHNRKHIALLWVCGVFIFVVIAVLIHYRGVKAVKKYELGDTIKAADFTQRDAAFDPESEKLPIGWHVRILRIGGVPTPVLVHVVDTTAPTAEPLPQTVPLGTHPQPDAFVSTDGIIQANTPKTTDNRIDNTLLFIVIPSMSKYHHIVV